MHYAFHLHPSLVSTSLTTKARISDNHVTLYICVIVLFMYDVFIMLVPCFHHACIFFRCLKKMKVKSMQRLGTEANRTKVQPSKPREPRRENTGFLHMRKQRRRSASSNREADQRLCFRHTDSEIPLLSKSEISSL